MDWKNFTRPGRIGAFSFSLFYLGAAPFHCAFPLIFIFSSLFGDFLGPFLSRVCQLFQRSTAVPLDRDC